MEVHTNPQTQIANESRPFHILYTVTPLSKCLAMGLFVVLPFFGGYVGYALAPQKVIEVEQVVEVVKEVSTESTAQTSDELARVNESIATTTIDMVSYQIRYTNNAVELLDGLDVVQTIPWDTSFRKVFTDDESLLITRYDINFDHYLDIGVLREVGYGGVNRFYHFYTFDPQSYRLVKVADFNTFEDDISNAVNPSMDVAERTLTSSIKSGQEWRYTKYQFDGKQYVQIDEWSESWGQEETTLHQLLDSPSSNVEICETQDVLACFGSGRRAAPELETDDYSVYALVSDDQTTRYGLINKQTGVLSVVHVSLDN